MARERKEVTNETTKKLDLWHVSESEEPTKFNSLSEAVELTVEETKES